MNTQQWLFLAIVFGVVVGLVWLAVMTLLPAPLRRRLLWFMAKEPAEAEAARGGAGGAGAAGAGGWVERVVKVARPFTKLSLPEEGWERSPLRTRFMNAGWRHPSTGALYFAAKSMLALLIPALVALFGGGMLGKSFLLVLFISASIGYYLPNLILARVASRRRREIFENFPDALDLLTVCVEAGLSLERGLVKVAGEIHIKSMALAQELQLVLMEMRAGFSKEKALRNLALRSGVEDVDTLVAMLIQSERFGTSMGDSLRVHSDNLRSKRNLVAEEAAAKIALKLLFPLIFCVFPALLVVLTGPAILQLGKSLSGSTDQPR